MDGVARRSLSRIEDRFLRQVADLGRASPICAAFGDFLVWGNETSASE
jgi:hypothetical protein